MKYGCGVCILVKIDDMLAGLAKFPVKSGCALIMSLNLQLLQHTAVIFIALKTSLQHRYAM